MTLRQIAECSDVLAKLIDFDDKAPDDGKVLTYASKLQIAGILRAIRSSKMVLTSELAELGKTYGEPVKSEAKEGESEQVTGYTLAKDGEKREAFNRDYAILLNSRAEIDHVNHVYHENLILSNLPAELAAELVKAGVITS